MRFCVWFCVCVCVCLLWSATAPLAGKSLLADHVREEMESARKLMAAARRPDHAECSVLVSAARTLNPPPLPAAPASSQFPPVLVAEHTPPLFGALQHVCAVESLSLCAQCHSAARAFFFFLNSSAFSAFTSLPQAKSGSSQWAEDVELRKQAKVSKVAQREAAALVAAENAKTEFEGASKQNKTRRKPTDRALVLALCQAFHTSLVSTKAGEKALDRLPGWVHVVTGVRMGLHR